MSDALHERIVDVLCGEWTGGPEAVAGKVLEAVTESATAALEHLETEAETAALGDFDTDPHVPYTDLRVFLAEAADILCVEWRPFGELGTDEQARYDNRKKGSNR